MRLVRVGMQGASGHNIPVRRRRAPVLTMEQVHQLVAAADPR
jgi:hypothetical protein